MESTTEIVDWEARAKAAEAEARKFEGKYRGLRRRIVEVGSREARLGKWCDEFDNTLAKIDPLLRRVKPAKDDYQVTVQMSFTMREQTQEPSEAEMLRLVYAWSSRWHECLQARTYGGDGIALSMIPTFEKITGPEVGEVYNPELDEDDFKALGQPIPVFDDDDDDEDDDF